MLNSGRVPRRRTGLGGHLCVCQLGTMDSDQSLLQVNELR